MKREIITIDESKCDGCGLCVPGCPEGALQIIDGKARLISDLFCDGLGACLGECPRGAITIEKREAEPYDERKVMANVSRQGEEVIRAHLEHLQEHGETAFLKTALAYLDENRLPRPEGFRDAERPRPHQGGCPGAAMREIERRSPRKEQVNGEEAVSQLSQWPVQLHLVNPRAPYFSNQPLLITADCVPMAYAGFHDRFLRGRRVVMLCPKLDSGIESYIEKLAELFKNQSIPEITVLHMEVPCCAGIIRIVETAQNRAGTDIPVTRHEISVSGQAQ